MKKALFFSYFWPPSGKASLLQPLKLVAHLPEFGIEPVVVTVNEESFTEKDTSMLALVPKELRVIRTKAWEPFDLYRKLLRKPATEKLVASETISTENKSFTHKLSVWLRMNLFIPDARIGWYPYAVSECYELLKKEKFDYIITNGPPHSTHLIGRRLAGHFGIPHVPIFIDPWVDIAYYQGMKRSMLTLMADNYFERLVVTEAKLNIFVTPSTRNDFVQKYPSIANKSAVLNWGYDADAFPAVDLSVKQNRKEKIIVHAGNIFDFQNPVTLWKSIAKRRANGEQFRIRFIGSVSPLVKKSIMDNGLQEITDFVGYLPYQKMLEEILLANYLLVCATEKRHIPGKLYEYMHTGNPIIAFADDNPDIEELLQQTDSGMLFRYDESPDRFFQTLHLIKPNIEAAKAYDRRVLTAHLAELLANIKS